MLDLEKGDIIEADIVNNSSTLSVKIQKDDTEPVYDNENVSTGTFEIEIEESGTYKITATGKKAKVKLYNILKIDNLFLIIFK